MSIQNISTMNEVPEENGMILSGKVNMRHFVKCMKHKGQYWILLLRWGSAEQPTIDTKKTYDNNDTEKN